MQIRSFLLTLCLTANLVCLLSSALQAQDSSKKALPAIAFDVSGQSLKSSPMFASMKFPPGNPAAKLINAKRFYGVMTLPESIHELIAMQPGTPIPLEVFMVSEFSNKEDRSQMLSDEMAENMELTTINGKEYRNDPTVPNTYLLLEETRFEVGTKDYLTATRSALLGNTLKQAMGELGKSPAKIVIDFDSHREFFLSAIDMLKQQGVPPPVAPFLDLPKRIDLLQLAIDPAGSELFKLVATSKKPEDAAFVSKSLNALLGMAKLGLGNAPKDQAGPELMTSLLASAQVNANGNRASLVITKPANFDVLLAKAVAEAEAATKEFSKLNDFKQVLLAMHNYESAYKAIPFLHTADGRLSDKLSWRVRVLPFVEQIELYQQFALDEAWDSETNKPLAINCPPCFGKDGKTSVCWIKSEVESFSEITDGMSNTICLIENPAMVGWTSPEDLTIEDAEKLIQSLPEGQNIIIGMYDGSVRRIDNTIEAETLHALLTPNGGEVVNNF